MTTMITMRCLYDYVENMYLGFHYVVHYVVIKLVLSNSCINQDSVADKLGQHQDTYMFE